MGQESGNEAVTGTHGVHNFGWGDSLTVDSAVFGEYGSLAASCDAYNLYSQAMAEGLQGGDLIVGHIGAGKEWPDLKKRTQQVPQNLQINWVGAMSNSDVIRYYQTEPIDIFINVSSSEGLPVSIMEAISFDIPVLATNVGGTSEIVTQESGMLIDADVTPEILATKIIELYKQRKNFHPRQFWQTHFSAAKNYPAFIKNILLG